jgi:hypothetical protein
MRSRSVRITIGRLMVAVLVAGLAMWGIFVIWPILVPSSSEQLAETAYKEAKLKRQVTEYAALMYRQESESEPYQDRLYQGALTSFDALRTRTRTLARLRGQDRSGDQYYDLADWKEARAYAENRLKSEIAATIQGLARDVETTRVREEARLAAYQRERARRLRGLGY